MKFSSSLKKLELQLFRQRSFFKHPFLFHIFTTMSFKFLTTEFSCSLPVLLALCIMAGCSEDDSEPAPVMPEITVSAFGNTGFEEIQMDIISNGGAPRIISLTEELGLQDVPFFRRDITNTSVAYYFWQDQQSKAFFKDLDSGISFMAENICGFSNEDLVPKSIRRISGNDTYLVMLYALFPNEGDPGFALRILNKATGQCQDLQIPEINTSGIVNYSVEGNLLGVYYLQAETNTPLISLVNLQSATLEETLILDDSFLAATFRGTELWIFNKDNSYLIYNTQSGNFTQSGVCPGLPVLGSGMIDSRFDGDRLLVRYIYQQPSLFFSQPAVYDFRQGKLTEGGNPFLLELQERVFLETGDQVLFGNYGLDLKTGVMAIIYIRGNGLAEGGLVLTNFDLEWLEVLPLPYVPEQLEIRSVAY